MKPYSGRHHLSSLDPARALGAEMRANGHDAPVPGAKTISAYLDRMHKARTGRDTGFTPYVLVRENLQSAAIRSDGRARACASC